MFHALLAVPIAFTLSGLVAAQTFTFPLEGSQETPPVVTTGSGECTLTLDAATGVFSVAGTYADLLGAATAAHIHGPAAPGASAGIVLTAGQTADMLAGLHYVNVHSGSFPGGELRGQVVQASSATPFGVGNPADSLTVLSGAPAVGGALTFGVDNPVGSQPVGSLPFVAIATMQDLLFTVTGSGFPVTGWGMSGPTGEMLIAIGGPNPVLSIGGSPWAGPGSPAPVPLAIPAQPSLIGLEVFAQGLMVNLIGPGPTFGLTNGLALTIGS